MGSSELLSSTGLMTNSVKEAACFDRSKLLCCSYRGFPKFAVNKSILFYSILFPLDIIYGGKIVETGRSDLKITKRCKIGPFKLEICHLSLGA